MSFMHKVWAKHFRQTPAERSIEPAIAALGVPYRSQFPCFLGVNPWEGEGQPGLKYFPDFVIPSKALVIEVDDDSHNEKAAEDALRSWQLWKAYGWRVVRISNQDALQRPVESLAEALAMPAVDPQPPDNVPESKARTSPRRKAGKASARGRKGP